MGRNGPGLLSECFMSHWIESVQRRRLAQEDDDHCWPFMLPCFFQDLGEAFIEWKRRSWRQVVRGALDGRHIGAWMFHCIDVNRLYAWRHILFLLQHKDLRGVL